MKKVVLDRRKRVERPAAWRWAIISPLHLVPCQRLIPWLVSIKLFDEQNNLIAPWEEFLLTFSVSISRVYSNHPFTNQPTNSTSTFLELEMKREIRKVPQRENPLRALETAEKIFQEAKVYYWLTRTQTAPKMLQGMRSLP
jgi:hypothetical protein